MSLNDDICSICFNNNNMEKFKCRTCKYSLCCDCLMKISSDIYDVGEREMKINFKCPVCRYVNIYTYNDFEKKDIITIANLHFYQSRDFYINKGLKTKIKEEVEIFEKKIKDLEKIIRDLKNKDEKSELRIKNLEIKDEKSKLRIKDLEIKDEKNKEQLTFFFNCIKNQSNNLKFICEMNKTKTINKNLLKPLYEEKIDLRINYI